MAPDIKNIPMVQIQVWIKPSLFNFGVSVRFVKYGNSQYVIPKKVKATVTPTVKWKCPTTHKELCTVWFKWWFVWAIPPAPAGINVIIAIIGAKKRTSFQGNFLRKPKIPLAPFFLPTLANKIGRASCRERV